MQHPVSLRMRSTWISIPLWKRAAGVILIACLAFQLVFLAGIWREWQIRARLSRNVLLYYGRSSLPLAIERLLNHYLPTDNFHLMLPVVSIVAIDPTDDELRTLAKLGYVKNLDVGLGRATSGGLKSLVTMNLLEDLQLRNASLDAQSLTGLPTCRKLRSLSLRGQFTPESLDPLRDCAALEVLKLEVVNPHAEGESGTHSITSLHLAAVARIPNLKRLTYSTTTIADADLRSLSGAEHLEALSIGAEKLQFGGDGLNALGRLPRLSLLKLWAATVHRSPKPLEGFPALRAFALHHTSLPPEFLASVKTLPQLETLSLVACNVNDSLPSLVGAPRLKRLNLSASDSTIDGIAQIARHQTIELIAVSESDLRRDVSALFPHLAKPPHFDWQYEFDLSNWTNTPRHH